MDKAEYVRLKKDHDVLKRIHNSLVESVKGVNTEMERLRGENQFLRSQMNNASQRVSISKDIEFNLIHQHQAEVENLVTEIKKLKKEVNRLKGLNHGNFN